MTAPKAGDIIAAAPRPDLLAPGTVRRPAWIREQDWARMPWPAQWRAARAGQRPVEPREELDEVAPAGPYRGGPVPASRECGTYAAYRRHLRRRERPCAACTEANRDYTRQRTGARPRNDVDPVLVERFMRAEVPWNHLTIAERVEAARRFDLDGISRNEIRRRTRLNTEHLRRAFACPQAVPGRVDETPCAAQHSERAS